MQRPVRILVIGVVCATTVSVWSAVGAMGATRWVAKDGTAGPTSCAGTRKAAKTIQAAVNASVAGDTVMVCAGTYRERIFLGGTRNKVTVRSASVGGATIRTPAAMSNVITVDGVADAVISGFTIQVDTALPCVRQNQVVMVQSGAARVLLSKLTIAPRGTDTMGSCGLARGVQVVGGSTATVKGGSIRDAQTDAVYAEGAGARVTVDTSELRFLHATATYPGFCNGWLVRARLGASLTVRGSTLAGRDGAGTASPLACAAVTLEDGGTGIVKTSSINGVNHGIQLIGGSDHQVSGVQITAGRGTSGHGVYVGNATGGTITDVTVTGMSGAGIWLTGSTTGVTVSSSDATGNAGPDCRDDATGTNTWSAVSGSDPIPGTICS